tara:strand:- start:3095 stop:3364 length:270 start_codon:yes stop_codon:yes gene_type:complete
LAKIDDEKAWLPGVANFGRRPTVNDRGALFEVNLFNIERNLYGSMLTISVIDFIRPEMKFSGLVELQAQIKLDAKVAGELLANRKGPLL